MASYTILVGDGPDLTLDTNVSFDLDAVKSRDGNGKVRWVDVFIKARGRIEGGGDPETIMDELQEKTDEVITKFLPVRIRINRDAVTEYDFTVGGSLEGTPSIEAFRTIPDAGQGEHQWQWELEITVRLPGNTFGGAKELHTSIRTTKNRAGQVMERVWRADCTHRTFQDALGVVRSLAPSLRDVEEQIEEQPQDARAIGVWVWSAKQKATGESILEITEDDIVYEGGDPDFIPETQVDETARPIKPVLHEAAGEEVRIIITGVTRALQKDISPPQAHFTPSANMTRVPRRERPGRPRLVDIPNGIYELRWSEYWLWTGATAPPDPDHHGHDDVIFETAPAKGSIAGSG